MRISDWSSDVCSSDLPRLRLPRISAEGERGGCGLVDGPYPHPITILKALNLGENRRVRLRAEADGVPIMHAIIAFVRLDRPTQIGRASCRERVCQYV